MSRQARLGLIVLGGVAAFVLALFLLANQTFLFSDVFRVKAEFGRVGGLSAGAPVQYRGISVGRVEQVRLPATPGGAIVVSMAIRRDARHLLREDTRANIQTDGLVGNMMVVLTGGSEERPMVAEGGFISGMDPMDLGQFGDRAMESVARFDSVTVTLTQIMQDVRTGDGTLGRFLYDPALYNELLATGVETRVAMRSLTAEANQLVMIASDASDGLKSIIDKVDRGEGTLARLINDDSIYEGVLAATAQFGTVSDDLRAISTRAEDAANWATLGMFRFAENMEALKHNWLFKRYYEQRGYLERAPFEIRERALEETFRTLEDRERDMFERERQLVERERQLNGVSTAPAPAPVVPAVQVEETAAQAGGGS
jgi:phospholipid/cholesterol/gamma-HCH transport system substrate-binding protein